MFHVEGGGATDWCHSHLWRRKRTVCCHLTIASSDQQAVHVDTGMHGREAMIADNHKGCDIEEASILGRLYQFADPLVDQLESMLCLGTCWATEVLPMISIKKMKQE